MRIRRSVVECDCAFRSPFHPRIRFLLTKVGVPELEGSHERIREAGPRIRVAGIPFDGAAEVRYGTRVRFPRAHVPEMATALVKIVCLRVACADPGNSSLFPALERRRKGARDGRGDLILSSETVIGREFKVLCPDVMISARIDQLRRDANAGCVTSHTAFQHV